MDRHLSLAVSRGRKGLVLLGKGIVEFKKGLSGVEDDIKQAGQSPGDDEDEDPSATARDTTDAEFEVKE